jgi:hypothetical protein
MAAINDQLVKMLSLTDGRDKLLKFVQGASKALAFYSSDKATAKQLNALAGSLGEGRSIMRLGKWTTNIQKLQGVVARAEAKGWDQLLVIEALRVLGDAGYVVGDNSTYLAKYRIVGGDPKLFTKYGKISQFWGFFFQVILDVVALSSIDAADSEARTAAVLTLVKDVSDLLVVLSVVQFLPKNVYDLNAGVAGSLLAISGGIATYQNWNKAAPSKAK